MLYTEREFYQFFWIYVFQPVLCLETKVVPNYSEAKLFKD